jgi:hypothetical protein
MSNNSNSNRSRSKAAALAFVQALIAGTKLHLPNGQFTLGGTAFTSTTLLQFLQGLVDALSAAIAEQARATDVLAASRAMEAKVAPVIRDFRRLVLATFPGATQTLADFGLTPPKAPTPRTTETNAAAKAKAKATREARGTVGSRKRLAVKGNVTGVLVTSVTAPEPAPPAPTVTTAPAATPPAPAGGGSATK